MIKDLIYDVGMNNGDDVAYYLRSGFRVVAIEADPTLCDMASVRFKNELKSRKLTILNIGIASSPGVLDFWICETASEWNSFDSRIASRDGLPHHRIQIPCQSFDWVLNNYGTPYYCKVDIEGNDSLCVEALRPGGDLPKYISVELGEIDSAIDQFEALGYTRYKCISQFYFLPFQLPPFEASRQVECKLRLLSNRDIFSRAICKINGIQKSLMRTRQIGSWTFPKESSGPFGEDTPGRWLTGEEIRKAISYYYQKFQQRTTAPSPFWTDKEYSFWADLHARRED